MNLIKTISVSQFLEKMPWIGNLDAVSYLFMACILVSFNFQEKRIVQVMSRFPNKSQHKAKTQRWCEQQLVELKSRVNGEWI